jgi:AraC-like DNA-binding protein
MRCATIPVRAPRFCELRPSADKKVIHYGGGGTPTSIISGWLYFEKPTLKPIARLLPRLVLIKAEQARSLVLHTTLQLLASEMADPAPGSEVVANHLAEILFIQAIRAHIASGADCRNPGWLRSIFDPQIGAALKSIHENVDHPWTVESLAEAASMSRSAFAARFKELLGQAPLEYVTEWRMQKAVRLLQQPDKKLFEIAKSVGYESDAAFSKAFKRVLGVAPGEHLRNDTQRAQPAGA